MDCSQRTIQGSKVYCNGLRKNSDTGVDCSHLHGTSFVDGFARVASTEEKAIGTAIGTVGRLVSEMK